MTELRIEYITCSYETTKGSFCGGKSEVRKVRHSRLEKILSKQKQKKKKGQNQ